MTMAAPAQPSKTSRGITRTVGVDPPLSLGCLWVFGSGRYWGPLHSDKERRDWNEALVGSRGLRQHKVLETGVMGRLPETSTEDLECSRPPGICGRGGSRDLPSQTGFPEAGIPEGSSPGSPHAAARGGAGRGRLGPSAPLAPPSPPGGSAPPGAGCRRTGVSRSPVSPAGGPDLYRCQSAGSRRARESVCSPGPGRVGHRGSPTLGIVPISGTVSAGLGQQVRPPRPTVRPAALLGAGRGEGRRPGTSASLFSHSSRRAVSPAGGFRPRIPGGGDGGDQPQAGAGCARRPRRVRPAEAALRAVRRVRGAPAAIQLPGLISSRGVRLGAGSQRAAAAAPRSASRKEPAAAAAGRGRSCIRAAPRPGQVSWAPRPPDPPAAAARGLRGAGGRGCCGPRAAPRTLAALRRPGAAGV